MSQNKRAPCQEHRNRGKLVKPAGTIAWDEHLQAWHAYAKKYGSYQSAERIAERGGFGWTELVALLGREPTTWQPNQ